MSIRRAIGSNYCLSPEMAGHPVLARSGVIARGQCVRPKPPASVGWWATLVEASISSGKGSMITFDHLESSSSEGNHIMNTAPNAKRMKSTNAPVPAHVAAIAESQHQHWSQAQGYIPGAKTISATLDCGHVKPFSAAIYAEYPQMIGCSRIICTAGKVRIMTTADVDVIAVEAFICEYADLVAEGRRRTRENHATFMSSMHMKERYESAKSRRQRAVQQQASRLRMK